MATAIACRPPHPESEGRLGFLAAFASAATEAAFRRHHLGEDRALAGFIVLAGMFRVVLAVLAGPHTPDSVLAARLLFVPLSVCVLLALRRAATPAAADRIFLGWGWLFAALTVYGLASLPPGETAPLLMSFSFVLVAYCITALPLSRVAPLALAYSAGALCVARHADATTLRTAALAHTAATFFGVVTSWRLNHRRRQAYLGTVREARLRAGLEAAAAEVRTLRGMLCICAWCKRVRDEAAAWQPVEGYVETRTAARFTHGICPDCLESHSGVFTGSGLGRQAGDGASPRGEPLRNGEVVRVGDSSPG